MTDEAEGRELLRPSQLGTKEYWDDVYARELRNHEADSGDEGTVWFSESNAEDAILAQLARLEAAGLLTRACGSASDVAEQTRGTRNPAPPARFLDLGTGNGHLLFALREEDEDGMCWAGQLVGVDYSETSVQLARRIAKQKQLDSVSFERWDLLSDPPGAWIRDGFDVVLDKGTFDAISLMPQPAGQPHPCATYRDRVVPLIKPGCFLSITSCNWTKDELLGWLAPEAGELSFYSEARYPTFSFGGKTGQSINTLLLQKSRTQLGRISP